MVDSEKTQVSLFYSYAHTDERLFNKLTNHLSLLNKQGLITQWHDHNISAGADKADQINHYINTAHIILLLISPAFLASDYYYTTEMKRALERHEAGEARIIPILLRPVDWEHAPFAKLQVLPQNERPITLWENQDSAFREIAIQLRKVVEELHGKESTTSFPSKTSETSNIHKQIDIDIRHLQTVEEFHLHLKKVNELKNIHDKLDEIELGLAAVLESIQFLSQEKERGKKQTNKWFIKKESNPPIPEFDIRTFDYIDTLWQKVVLKIDDLVHFATYTMEALEDERFSDDNGIVRGALWVTRPFILRRSIETAIRDQNMNDIQKLSDKLLTECRGYLHRIDKRLLETIEQLDHSSDILMRHRI